MKNLHIKLMLLVLSTTSLSVHAQQIELITTQEERSAYHGKNYLVVKSLTLKPGFTFNGAQGSFYAKVHPDAVLPTAPSESQNFVRIENIRVQGIATEDQVRALNHVNKATTFSYSDGAGKPLQSVSIASAPGLKDVVQPTYYDAFGRPQRQYLPFVAGSTTGAYQNNALAQQAAFYANTFDKIADDAKPYSEVTFDASPTSRIIESRKVGSSFAGKVAYSRAMLNDAGVVREWTLTPGGLPASSSFYTAGMLTVGETEDEEGRKSRSYTDWLGRTIMTETQTTENRWAQTYYVYNEYGSILYVIPPAATTNLTPDQTYADRWYFQTRYDVQQRVIASRSPGTSGWTSTVYDQWDRVVLTQDANQATKNPREWSFVKYDAFNRPVMTGLYSTTETNIDNVRASVAASAGRFETRTNSAVGYTLTSSFPTNATEASLLSVTYYDDYAFLGYTSWDTHSNSYAFVPEGGFTGTFRDGTTKKVLDFTTGGKTKILGTGNWLTSVIWYDDEFRPLQTIAKNIFNKIDRITSEYASWTGEVLKTKRVHVKGSTETITQERFEYDHEGRLLRVYHKINNQPEILLQALDYNELDQVVDKKLYSDNGGSTWLQSIDYRYNVQGALTHINYTALEAGDPIDYFSQELAYHTSAGTGNTARYDGVITASKWKHDLSTKDRSYNYTYDKQILTEAAYQTASVSGTTEQNAYTENGLRYDLNGNITELDRYGWKSLTAQKIDDLSYGYGTSGGNQLMSVGDGAASTVKADGFSDGNTAGDDYVYDANGNLIQDKNKSITITYNLLDLPERITFNDNSYLRYTYDAGGARLTEAYFNAANVEQYRREYVGEFVYYSTLGAATEPVLIHHSQGRLVQPSYTNLIANTATREANTTDGFAASQNVTLTQETLSSETYVKAVCNQSTSTPGALISSLINVKPGESYSFKVLAYQSVGTSASLYVKGNNGSYLVWPGATIPVGSANQSWTTSTFTVPAGVSQVQIGVLWSAPASGHTLYINRVAVYKTDWEYQFFLNDHLGSVRTVLQTTPNTFTYAATMESQNHAHESSQFFNLSSTNQVAFAPANATPGGSKAYVMNASYKVGPARSFRVLPGDVIDANVMAYYPSGGTHVKNGLTAMGTAVASVLAGGTTAIVDGINASYTGTGSNPAFLLSPDQGSGKPSAFLNYILFNEHYQPIEARSQPVGSNANTLHAVVLPTISVKETGYLFVYLSYDNTSGGDVYFDELKITYQESPVVQVNSYYPYGLPAFVWNREGEVENKYKFQGKELDEHTGWHDFHARQYDGETGRWLAVDPAGQFVSPYSAMGNNPVMTIDPDGRLVWFVPVIIGAVVGGTAGGIIAHNNGQDWYKGAITGAFIGAAVGLGVSAAIGPTGGITGMTVGNSTAATAQLTKAWGVASTAIQGANVNMAMTAIQGGNLDNVYKSGIVGAASGLFTATGGFGMVNAWGSQDKTAQFIGRQLYQGIGTAGRSIGNNWAAGRDPFSRVTVGAGPVNLTFGKGQQLLQWQNNIGNIAMNSFGLLNTAFGGKVQWDWNHLTPVYKGGLIDKFADPRSMESGFSPYVVTGNSNVTGEIYSHELHHVWQSRAMGDMFAPNYVANGFFGMILNRFRYFAPYGGMNYPAFISPTRNYWETVPDFYPWWR
jgi:RHS repeat-associated protein